MRMSLKGKMLLGTSLAVTLSLIISGLFTYNYFSSILKEQTVRDEKAKIRQKALQLENFLDDVKNYAYNIILDQQLLDFLKSSSSLDETERYLEIQKNIARLDNSASFNSYIQSYTIITENREVYWSQAVFDKYFKALLEENWYEPYKNGDKNGIFTNVHKVYDRTLLKEVNVISYVINFVDIENQRRIIGQYILNIYLDDITRILAEGSEDFDDYFCFGQENMLYFHKKSDNTLNNDSARKYINSTEFKNNPDHFLEEDGNIIIGQTTKNGWSFVSFILESKLYGKLYNILNFYYVIILLSIVFIIIINLPIISGITRPLLKLTSLMKQVSEGRMEVNLEIKSGDEIELLSNGFNKMVKDLKEHIAKLLQHEENKKRMEFNLLLLQINPHFIYNTLGTVIYLARKQNTQDIIKTMESFIRILQDSVKIGESGITTTVRSEMEIVDHYVQIQRLRYHDMFELKWEVDDRTINCQIPRTLIQPLVENAIFHGICPKEEQGKINVTICRENENLIIKVRDTGMGMKPEKLARILESSESKGSSDSVTHIGLVNTNERIKHMYGDNFGIAVESVYGEGTVVIVKIPYLV